MNWNHPLPICAESCSIVKAQCLNTPNWHGVRFNKDQRCISYQPVGSFSSAADYCNSDAIQGRLAGFRTEEDIKSLMELVAATWYTDDFPGGSWRTGYKRLDPTSTDLTNYYYYETASERVQPLVTLKDTLIVNTNGEQAHSGVDCVLATLIKGRFQVYVTGSCYVNIHSFCEKDMPCSQECPSPPIKNAIFDYSSSPVFPGVTAVVTCQSGYYLDGKTSVTIECGADFQWPDNLQDCLPRCKSLEGFCARQSDSVENSDTCLSMHLYGRDWNAAQDTCNAKEMSLATFQTEDEYNLLIDLWKETNFWNHGFIGAAWNIGYKKESFESHFAYNYLPYKTKTQPIAHHVSLEESALLNYSQSANPLLYENKDANCVVLTLLPHNVHYPYTRRCNIQLSFICSRDMRCHKSCPTFSVELADVTFSQIDNVVGSTATIVCNEGFELNDTQTLLCLTGGIWNNPIGTCIAITTTTTTTTPTTTSTSTAPATTTSVCPNTWFLHGRSCFKHISGTFTHSDGQLACQAENSRAQLPIFANSSDYAAFKSYISNSKLIGKAVRLGGNDNAQEGKWIIKEYATAAECEIPYTEWDVGQPDNHAGAQHCAVKWENSLLMDDVDCTAQLEIVCQIPMYFVCEQITTKPIATTMVTTPLTDRLLSTTSNQLSTSESYSASATFKQLSTAESSSTPANNNQPSTAELSSASTNVKTPSTAKSSSKFTASTKTAADSSSSEQMTSNSKTSMMSTEIMPINEELAMSTESDTTITQQMLPNIDSTNNYQAPTKICCIAENWMLKNHELDTVIDVTVGDCCQICSCNKSCSGFSFVKSTGSCFMTSYIPPGGSGVESKLGAVTGISQSGTSCPPSPIPTELMTTDVCTNAEQSNILVTTATDENQDPGENVICCSGENFKIDVHELDRAVKVSNAEECCQTCKCTESCEGFSYVPATKECLMTSNFPSGLAGMTMSIGVISGVIFKGTVCPASPVPTIAVATNTCTERAQVTSSISNGASMASEPAFSTTSMNNVAEVALETTTVALKTTAIATKQERKCCIYENVGLEGDLPPVFNISSYGECCTICHCTQQCKAFAYYKDKSTCIFTMTQDISRIKMPDPNAVVGGVVEEECSPMYDAYVTKIEDIKTGTCPSSTDEAAVSSSEITIIGDPGDACSVACLRKGMKCDIGLLKSITTEETKSLMQKISSNSETKFEAWHEEMTKIKHCPFVNSINQGFCPETSKINPTCSARPGPDQRRLCPCTQFDSTFIGATGTDSCEQACQAKSKSCRFDRIFRLSKEELKVEMAKLTDKHQEELIYQTHKIRAEETMKVCPFFNPPTSVYCYEPGDFNPNCNSAQILVHRTTLCECADIQMDNFDGFCDPHANDCQNDGNCYKNVDNRGSQICVCKPGYSGTRCEIANDACRNNLCVYPAVCVDHHSHYTCDCPPGKTGKYCNTNSNDCEPFPCLVGENCFDLVDGFKCIRQTEVDAIKELIIKNLGSEFPGSINDLNYIEEKILPHLSLATLNTYLVSMVPYMLEGTADELVEEIGYSLKDMLLGCYYDDRPCAEWTRQYHPQYGNCYTFNNNLTRDPYYVARPGAKYGLILQLNFDSEDYMSNIESSAMKIVFHNPGVKPDPDNEGRSIMPRFLSTFRIQYKMVDALPSPYPSNCIQDKSEVTPYFYKEKYSVSSCSKSYMQQKINTMCDCAVPEYALAPGSNYSLCAMKRADANCVSSVINGLTFDNETEHCDTACRNEFYTVVDTKSEQLLHKRCNKVVDADRCMILRNIGMVEAFFTSVTIEHLTEVPETTVPQLIASMGGFTGLFVGASVITLVELFYMALYYINLNSQ